MSIPWFWVGPAVGVVVGVAVLASCRSATSRSGGSPSEALAMDDVARGVQSGVMERSSRVIRTREEWEALWSRHARLQLPPPPAPAIDFDETMVIAVFCGTCPSAGFGVEIEEVDAVVADPDDEPPVLTVYAKQSEPGPDAFVAQVTTAPFHIVRVPLAEGDAKVVWQ